MPKKSKYGTTTTGAKDVIGSRIKPVPNPKKEIGVDTDDTLLYDVVNSANSNSVDISKLEGFTTATQSREQIYKLIDTMAEDPILASYLKTISADAVETNDRGQIVWCESDDGTCGKYVSYLLTSLNIDKNIYKWMHSLIKYGDLYLRLFRGSDYGNDSIFDSKDIKVKKRDNLNESKLTENVNVVVHDKSDHYVHYVEMIPNPVEMFELTKFGKTMGYVRAPISIQSKQNAYGIINQSFFQYKLKQRDVDIYSPTDFVHACLDDNSNRVPEEVDIFLNDEDYDNDTKSNSYIVKRGQSELAPSFKIWRELSLLENSALLNRITKSSITRTIQVEVGSMPKEQVGAHIQAIKSLFEQKSALNVGESMAEYTNPGSMENIIYLPTRDNKGGITVGTVGGDFDPKKLTDIEYFQDKLFGALGVPKQYFGCLRGNTDIKLLDGSQYSIEYMYNNKDSFIGKGILSCEKDGTIIPTKISDIKLTKKSTHFIKITLDNGNSVDVTEDHMMMLRDGSFVLAKNIVVGDSLMPYYSKVINNKQYILDNNIEKYLPQCLIVAKDKVKSNLKSYQVAHKDENSLNDDFNNLEVNVISKSEDKLDISRIKYQTGDYAYITDLNKKSNKYNAEKPQELISCDSNLQSEYNHKVVSITLVDVQEPAYDISVESACHTFALPCGIFVHNCTGDSAGFDGGKSLSIISSRYGKSVKRLQNTMCKTITDLINLFLLDKGLTTYINKFTIRMQEPVTQEELDRRDNKKNKIAVVSDIMLQLADVKDPLVKLKILKSLLSDSLSDAEVIDILQQYIESEEKLKNTSEQKTESINDVGGDSDMDMGMPPMPSSGSDMSPTVPVDIDGGAGIENGPSDNTAEVNPAEMPPMEDNTQVNMPGDNGATEHLPNPSELDIDMTDNS